MSWGKEVGDPRWCGWPKIPDPWEQQRALAERASPRDCTIHVNWCEAVGWVYPRAPCRGIFLLRQRHLAEAAELGAELPARETARHFQKVIQPICSQRASRDVSLMTAPQLLATGFLSWKPQWSAWSWVGRLQMLVFPFLLFLILLQIQGLASREWRPREVKPQHLCSLITLCRGVLSDSLCDLYSQTASVLPPSYLQIRRWKLW